MYRGGDGVSGNVRGSHRLTCGTAGRTNRSAIRDFTRSSMSRKRDPAYIGHPEHSRSFLLACRLDTLSWALISWASLFKVRRHAPGAVSRPDGKLSVTASSRKQALRSVRPNSFLPLLVSSRCSVLDSGCPRLHRHRPPLENWDSQFSASDAVEGRERLGFKPVVRR